MSVSEQVFDGLVSSLYNAGARLHPWKIALDAIATAYSAWNTHLMGVDLKSGVMLFSHEGGDPPPEGTLDYIRTWHKVDPRAAAGMTLSDGDWLHDHEVFDEEFVANDPFYRDFLIPYGMRYVSGVRLDMSAELVCFFSVSRGVGKSPFNEQERGQLKRLGEHFRNAMKMHQDQSALIPPAHAGFGVLERLRYPAILIDRDRTVFFANAPANDLLARSTVATLSARRFRFKAEEHDRGLTVLMKELELNQIGTQAKPSVLIIEGRPSQTYIVHLADARPQSSMGAFGLVSMVLITFFEASATPELDPFVVQAAFGLTPAEARVAVAIAQGSTIEEIAKLRRVTNSTIRAQLNVLMHKIGVPRQAALATLLAGNPAFWGPTSRPS